MKKKKNHQPSDYELGVRCEVCDSLTIYDDDCGCLICFICRERKKIEYENTTDNRTMGIRKDIIL